MAVNFIILADDYLAVESKIEEIKKGFNLDVEPTLYNLDEEGTYAVVDELTTVSLFDETKFVVVRNAEGLLKSSDRAFLDLLKAMNDQNSSNILILVFQQKSLFQVWMMLLQLILKYANISSVFIDQILSFYLRTKEF